MQDIFIVYNLIGNNQKRRKLSKKKTVKTSIATKILAADDAQSVYMYEEMAGA